MKTLLIVDDEYDILSTLEMACSFDGYQVRTAYNGKEALVILGEDSLPDLIISDLMMPVMDGYQLVKAVKEDAKLKHIPIILMSAAQIDQTKVKQGLYEHFVKKPFDLNRMMTHIENSLNHSASSE